jgi:TPR repeat protein
VSAALAALLLLAPPARPAAKADPLSALVKACGAEDGRACAELSRRYRAGDGAPRDLKKAVAAAEDGCEAGEPALCVEAGRAVLRGEGVKPDPERARELFSDACTQRTHAGCLDLALMLQNGSGVPQDTAAAAALFEKACEGGDASACQLLGDALYAGVGIERDLKGAQAAYQRGCGMALFSSCTKLADLLRVQHDPAAEALYKKACAADEKDACTVLALKKDCAGRDACLDLADLCSDYLAGYDVLAEAQLARGPCEKACAGGVGEACDNLADMYQEGYGAPRDLSQAAVFRKRACDLGDRDACDVRE